MEIENEIECNGIFFSISIKIFTESTFVSIRFIENYYYWLKYYLTFVEMFGTQSLLHFSKLYRFVWMIFVLKNFELASNYFGYSQSDWIFIKIFNDRCQVIFVIYTIWTEWTSRIPFFLLLKFYFLELIKNDCGVGN